MAEFFLTSDDLERSKELGRSPGAHISGPAKVSSSTWWRHEAVVKFQGPFPLDMLRYAGAYPADSHACTMIVGSFVDGFDSTIAYIRLAAHVDTRKWDWHRKRWESFGCRVWTQE